MYNKLSLNWFQSSILVRFWIFYWLQVQQLLVDTEILYKCNWNRPIEILFLKHLGHKQKILIEGPYAVKMCWEKAPLFCWESCREYLVSTTCIFGNSYIMGKMEKPSVKVDKFLLISCQFDSLKPFCTAASSSWYAFGRLAGSALCLRGNTHNGRLLTQLAWSLTATYQTKNTNYNFLQTLFEIQLIQIDNVFPATHSWHLGPNANDFE